MASNSVIFSIIGSVASGIILFLLLGPYGILNPDLTAHLTVINNVISNDIDTKQASDFTINVNGIDVSQNPFPSSQVGTTVTLKEGVYGVGISHVSGYESTKSSDCSGTIKRGEHKTCSITTTYDTSYLAHLIVIAHVNNTGGGLNKSSDFILQVFGENPNPPNPETFSGNETGTIVTLIPGQQPYQVEVNGSEDYSINKKGDCNTIIDKGETKTCTITFTYNAGSIGGPPSESKVLMAWKGAGTDTNIYFAQFDGTNWTVQQAVPGVGTSNGPSLIPK